MQFKNIEVNQTKTKKKKKKIQDLWPGKCVVMTTLKEKQCASLI